MGARLQSTIIKSIGITFDRISMWTDSTIVLRWLSMSPHSLKVLVQNRIAEINDLMSSKGLWCHVGGKSNPADLSSHGTSLADSLVQICGGIRTRFFYWNQQPTGINKGMFHLVITCPNLNRIQFVSYPTNIINTIVCEDVCMFVTFSRKKLLNVSWWN